MRCYGWLLIGGGENGSNFAGFSETNSWKKQPLCGKFAEIFGATFAKKESVKNDRFHGNFLGKFCWKGPLPGSFWMLFTCCGDKASQ